MQGKLGSGTQQGCALARACTGTCMWQRHIRACGHTYTHACRQTRRGGEQVKIRRELAEGGNARARTHMPARARTHTPPHTHPPTQTHTHTHRPTHTHTYARTHDETERGRERQRQRKTLEEEVWVTSFWRRA
jgi:hypothetical protein